jgi:hypothetical protein
MRYAIYFAPSGETDLWRFGSSVIGYDALVGQDIPHHVPHDFTLQEWRILTEAPRRYGFHATLKAPFRLAPGESEYALIETLADFATASLAFDVTLQVENFAGFAALTPRATPDALMKLEADVVEAFEPFRAQQSEDMVRRQQPFLTPRQAGYLRRYGYPYVLDDFRFHMSLTGGITNAAWRAGAVAALAEDFAAHCDATVSIDRIALFREENGRFRIVAAFPFG